MAKPKRGEVWLVDMGYAAKVRPALVLSIPIEGDERAITMMVPHTTSVRGTRFETNSNVPWLKDGVFDAQGIGTYPTVKLIRKLGDLPAEQLAMVEKCVRQLLALPYGRLIGTRLLIERTLWAGLRPVPRKPTEGLLSKLVSVPTLNLTCV